MPLSEKYPGTQLRGFWLQQTLGFEVGVRTGGALRIPRPKTAAYNRSQVDNRTHEVPFAIGDDAPIIVDTEQAIDNALLDREEVLLATSGVLPVIWVNAWFSQDRMAREQLRPPRGAIRIEAAGRFRGRDRRVTAP